MMKLEVEALGAIAAAAQIALCAEELQKYAGELAELESLCAPLLQVSGETDGDPFCKAIPLTSLRSDEVEADVTNDNRLLALCGESVNGYIRVPRTVGEGVAE